MQSQVAERGPLSVGGDMSLLANPGSSPSVLQKGLLWAIQIICNVLKPSTTMDFNQVPLKSPELSFVYVLKMCFCVKNKLYDVFSWVVLKSRCQEKILLRSE